jgi:hypothetical protein
MLEGIRGISDDRVAQAVEEFLGLHPLSSGTQQVAQHVERMWVTVAAARRARAELGRSPGMLGNAAS